ncbi:MAG: hypothetical protein HZA11_07845 [Nitrospirae bacterium]|nr:hypothetical protein [Nitrospirota bacterium]
MGYRIERDVQGFILYQNEQVLLKFFRESFRDDLELYAQTNNLSSQWVGCILRLFLKKFPSSPPRPCPAVERFRNDELIEYLKCKGYKITTPLRSGLDDTVIISHLEKQGYVVQGNNHYSPALFVTLN